MQWLAVLGMGLVLGAVGGGGGILTVPILLAFFGLSATKATGASLLVVGLTSSVGAFLGLRKGESDTRAALLLAVPSSIGAFTARAFLLPSIPATIGGVSRDKILLGGFALLMILVALRMAIPQKPTEPKTRGPVLVALIGLTLGLVAGTFGAGGGFLILPALILLLGTDIKRAIPTSLLVITIQSLIGFTGEISKGVDWNTLLPVAAVAVAGLLVGIQVRGQLPGRTLQLAFSVVVFSVAGWMISRVI